MVSNKPLFSIGVPTYNRKDLLRQTLLSLLEQTFTDFEVIVGNDFPDEPLSVEKLGIEDPRIRFINHKQNIGELENMNSLLSMANGRYFTWQFDDDPCAPTFLSKVYSALIKYDFPLCVFTSYSLIYGAAIYRFRKNYNGQMQLFSGRDFLRAYLSGSLKAMGCCGFYNIDYLKSIGGVQRLTDGQMALYTENLLLIRVGLLPEVVYINAPLVTYRLHGSSWTYSNNDVELFKKAGLNLIRESIIVLSMAELENDFRKNISAIMEFAISSVVAKSVMRNKRINSQEIGKYLSLIKKEFEPFRGSKQYQFVVSRLEAAFKNIPGYIFKTKIKMLIPFECLKFAHMVRSFYLRYINKVFD